MKSFSNWTRHFALNLIILYMFSCSFGPIFIFFGTKVLVLLLLFTCEIGHPF